jgi:hypothetical protein
MLVIGPDRAANLLDVIVHTPPQARR